MVEYEDRIRRGVVVFEMVLQDVCEGKRGRSGSSKTSCAGGLQGEDVRLDSWSGWEWLEVFGWWRREFVDGLDGIDGLEILEGLENFGDGWLGVSTKGR